MFCYIVENKKKKLSYVEIITESVDVIGGRFFNN